MLNPPLCWMVHSSSRAVIVWGTFYSTAAACMLHGTFFLFIIPDQKSSRVVVAKESGGTAEGSRGERKAFSTSWRQFNYQNITNNQRNVWPTFLSHCAKSIVNISDWHGWRAGVLAEIQGRAKDPMNAMVVQFSRATIDFWLGTTTAMILRIWLEQHGHKATCRVPIFHLLSSSVKPTCTPRKLVKFTRLHRYSVPDLRRFASH